MARPARHAGDRRARVRRDRGAADRRSPEAVRLRSDLRAAVHLFPVRGSWGTPWVRRPARSRARRDRVDDAPSFAAAMGLDATLVLVTLVVSSALTPFTAPMFAHLFIGSALTLAPLALGLKLLVILAGSALVALVIRRITGPPAIERLAAPLAGRMVARTRVTSAGPAVL